jgi:transposase
MSGSEWLSDAAWAVIEPHLPKGRPGAPRVDDRRVHQRHPARAALRLPLERLPA